MPMGLKFQANVVEDFPRVLAKMGLFFSRNRLRTRHQPALFLTIF